MKPQPLKQKNLFDLEYIRQQAAFMREQNPTNRPDPPKCSVCGDNEGYAVRLDDGREVYRQCDCTKGRNIERRFESSKITFAFRNMNFTAFNLEDVHPLVRDAYRIAQDYTRDFDKIQAERKNSIALLGRPGSGKTHLLMSISNELLDRGKELLYFPYAEGFSEFKNNFDLLDERIRKMQTAEVLFIDDLWKGRDKPTPWQIEQMFIVINYRYMEHKPILVSSERSFNDMMSIDEAVGSRLLEMSNNYRLTLTGGRELNYRISQARDKE